MPARYRPSRQARCYEQSAYSGMNVYPSPVEHTHVQAAPSDPRWDDRNVLNAMLSRVGGSNRHGATERAPPMHRTQSSHSSASHHQALQPQAPAEDIQAELLALSMRARQQERSQRNTPQEVEEQLLREQIMRREHEQQQQQQLLLLHQQQQQEQVTFVSLSKPGVSLLTELLNRVHLILQASGPNQPDGPTPDEVRAWSMVYAELFHALGDHLFSMFPSIRIAGYAVATNPGYYTRPPHVSEAVDQHVCHFIALLAAHGSAAEHTAIIGRIREKIMENARIINNRWLSDEEELLLIATDTNLLLHVVGLDIAQLS
ncbi:hypothetical protein AURDEDRAFT_120640 [Auricularia subglabra TFB-10046 SS5]|nr:hypothetical protein AURDEDRAFT_120640 [Auricularia subglabra TFB-10046 SS5]